MQERNAQRLDETGQQQAVGAVAGDGSRVGCSSEAVLHALAGDHAPYDGDSHDGGAQGALYQAYSGATGHDETLIGLGAADADDDCPMLHLEHGNVGPCSTADDLLLVHPQPALDALPPAHASPDVAHDWQQLASHQQLLPADELWDGSGDWPSHRTLPGGAALEAAAAAAVTDATVAGIEAAAPSAADMAAANQLLVPLQPEHEQDEDENDEHGPLGGLPPLPLPLLRAQRGLPSAMQPRVQQGGGGSSSPFLHAAHADSELVSSAAARQQGRSTTRSIPQKRTAAAASQPLRQAPEGPEGPKRRMTRRSSSTAAHGRGPPKLIKPKPIVDGLPIICAGNNTYIPKQLATALQLSLENSERAVLLRRKVDGRMCAETQHVVVGAGMLGSRMLIAQCMCGMGA